MHVGPLRRVLTLIRDARFSLVTALLAGFGRAAADDDAKAPVGEADAQRNLAVVEQEGQVEPGMKIAEVR